MLGIRIRIIKKNINDETLIKLIKYKAYPY